MTVHETHESVATALRAHAKLTLSLRVIGVRADGYHFIDAEMVSLELHDLVGIIDPDPSASGTTRSNELSATGPFADGVPLDRTNLAWSALDLAQRRAHVAIDKRIPHGGGLGGGSADAAAVLRWANFGTDAADLERAGGLGADIPFCLVGGRARVTGIGECVEPLPFVDQAITLVIPPLQVSTPAVYRAWDDLDRRGDRPTHGANDLEAPALVVEPALRRWRALIGDRIGVAPTLAGSGATWFALGDHRAQLADLSTRGATVVSTRTVDRRRATGPGT
jgi:4-diphosphocytidyl-2-C-methyl-D-erythritol kinase